MTSTVDLGTQSHTFLLYDLDPLWLITSYKLDLGVDCDILNGEDLRNSYTNYIDSIFDHENESETQNCMTFLFLYL